ncbi:MAG: hypothetical protein QOJ11_3429 [Frankiales bacterium]|jgi:hypothetical protein|nr:hypothetical protein [Frankiales bacterium]
MTDEPGVFSQRWSGGDRVDPACLGDERTMLSQYLDYQRSTFELKCAGVAPGQLSALTVPPSTLSLHGLLRHLSGVERWWFRIQFAGEQVPELYYSDDDPDQDFDSLDGDAGEALEVWRRECARSREIARAAESMDSTGTRRLTGEPFSLRWVMLRLVAEYARHNGHADLLRQRIDGRTGE